MGKISIIAPDNELEKLALGIINTIEIENKISILKGSASQVVKIACKEAAAGADVIISRGGNFSFIERAQLSIPIVEIGISYKDLLNSLWQAKGSGNTIVAVGYEKVHGMIDDIAPQLKELMNMNIISYEVRSDSEIVETIESIQKSESKKGLVFIGGDEVIHAAAEIGCPSVLLKSTEDSVVKAIYEAERIIETNRKEKERSNLLKAIFNHMSDGVFSVDKEGKITTINRVAAKLMNVEEEEIIGKPVSINSIKKHIYEVLHQGTPLLGKVNEIGTITTVTNNAPIVVDNEILGAMTTIQDVTYLQKLEKQVRKKLSGKGFFAKYTFFDIVGKSVPIKKAITQAKRVAKYNYTVLITAETGSGKEIFAHSIHSESMRKSGPFVAVNCGSLPDSLLEAELFGYTEGSFTGATKGGKPGLFEQSDGGTIFLDEISQISSHLQILLLRVLQEKEVRRIGDTQLRPVDVRIIAASNKKLIELVEEGFFREDLYYRLNVLNLSIPPLRDRKEDIPLLATHFLSKFPHHGSAETVLSKAAIEVLQDYHWPGNVRQLENTIIRLMVTIDNKESIDAADVEQNLRTELSYKGDSKADDSGSMKSEPDTHEKEKLLIEISNNFAPIYENSKKKKDAGLLQEIENKTILEVLEKVNWNRQEAARILGINSSTIWRRLNKMNHRSAPKEA